uniref:Uncharacterized protein n=2 Tax=Clytia hemisphaerica TaxID=252671 RepID=A0A7M5WVD3_9CNID
MDERHWWITSKLLESFTKGVLEGKSVVEDFMTDGKTLKVIDKFFTDESDKVILFCIVDTNGKKSLAIADSGILSSLLQENVTEDVVVYFIKCPNVSTVTVTNVEQEIYCGEIKQSAIVSFRDLVQKNIMKFAQKHLKVSNVTVQESKSFLLEMNKYAEMLVEFSNAAEIPQQILNIPLEQSIGTFRSRQTALSANVVAEYETYLQEWMQSIEHILMEHNSEDGEEDLYQVPSSMLAHWQKRLKRLSNVMLQVKTKQCKTVMAVLMTARSKLMRRWKVFDAGLTDAYNDAKDKVKYLELLLNSCEFDITTSKNLTKTLIPNLLANIKQSDSLSRYYAKTGFLGSFLCKFSFQLVECLKSNIKSLVVKELTSQPLDLWNSINEEVLHGEHKPIKVKLKTLDTPGLTDIMTVVLTALIVHQQYLDLYKTTCDTYGVPTKNLVSAAQMLSKRLKQVVNLGDPQNNSSLVVLPTNDKSYCVTLSDIKTILRPMTIFIERINQLKDIVESLKQFHGLVLGANSLPLLNVSDLNDAEESDSESDDNEEANSRMSSALGPPLVTHMNFCQEIKTLYEALTTHLRSNITLDIVMDHEGQHRERFHQLYLHFIKIIAEMEEKVETYTKGILEMKWNTLRRLEILACFHPLTTRSSLNALFKEHYDDTLMSFTNDMERVEETYMKLKDNAPTGRNLPTLSSSINWSRQLYHQIEAPMETFKDIKIVTELQKYPLAVKTYNKLATVLLCFEEKWMEIWRNQTEPTIPKLMKSSLLAIDTNNNKLVVHSNSRMFEVFKDIRSLKRLKVSIPKSLLTISAQEKNYKFYHQQLEYFVGKYYEIEATIPKDLEKLLMPMNDAVLATFQPGISILTWDNVNVDGYLHQLDVVISDWQSIISYVNIAMKKLTQALSEMTSLLFIDKQTVFQQVWTTEDFATSCKDIIKQNYSRLSKLISNIDGLIKDVVRAMTSKTRMESAYPPHVNQNNNNSPKNVLANVKINAKYLFSQLNSIFGDQVLNIIKQCTLNTFQEFLMCCSIPQSHEEESVCFKVDITFKLPNIVLSPTLSQIQSTITDVGEFILETAYKLKLWDHVHKNSVVKLLSNDQEIQNTKALLEQAVLGISASLSSSLLVFDQFNFLWTDDMHNLYKTFEEENPDPSSHHQEVKRIIEIEHKIKDVFDEKTVGCMKLNSTPIKDSLAGFCMAWKMCYVQKLHNHGKETLNNIVNERTLFFEHLNSEIVTLQELDSVLDRTQHIIDLDNLIDEKYLPVERLYKVLTDDYEIPLPREELQTVSSLRDKWSELLVLAEKISQRLIHEHRSIFEQELDKQVKEFVVAVIRFRNSFDSQGPGVPGILPKEAALRLKNFQEQYNSFQSNMKTLHAVQKLYGIMPTPFTELEKTGTELEMLGMLYDIYKVFLKFDLEFRESLWADINLEEKHTQLNILHDNCMGVPTEIHGWYAFKKLIESINDYINLFPILYKLASKEIRNRHWLQVMHVTKKSFQLEANIFKLKFILDIDLLKHRDAIEEILCGSKAELELEMKLRHIEEEWTEQILKFQSFKSRGLVLFDQDHMNHLLDTLGDAKTTLSAMLTSKYVKPLREEAATWSLKLDEVSEVLEEWLLVEELWINLEAIFSIENMVKELPEQSTSFVKADRSYMKLMKKSSETANVLQCCLGGDVSKVLTIKQIYRELETCFKSLKGYLNEKRKVFPRFHFVPDEVLLCMLSKRLSIETVTPYIRDVILAVNRFDTITTNQNHRASIDTSRASSGSPQSLKTNLMDMPVKQQTRKKFSIAIQQRERFSMQSAFEARNSQRGSYFDYLVDSSSITVTPDTSVTAVVDSQGEKMYLDNHILLEGYVETWMSKILSEIKNSVKQLLSTSIQKLDNGVPFEEVLLNTPAQIGVISFYYYFTKETERAVLFLRSDRKSLTNLAKKFSGLSNRLSYMLSHGVYRPMNVNLSRTQKIRVENVLGLCFFAVTTIDKLIAVKMRDTNDFEWRQTVKCYAGDAQYLQTTRNNSPQPPRSHTPTRKNMSPPRSQTPRIETIDERGVQPVHIKLLDFSFTYQNEFHGCQLGSVVWVTSDKAFLNLMTSLTNGKAGCVSCDQPTGRSGIIDCLKILCGQHCFTLDCASPLSYQSIGHLFLGIIEDGSWCTFSNFDQLSSAKMNLVQYFLFNIHQFLKQPGFNKLVSNKGTNHVDGFRVTSVHPNCGVFLTTTTSYIHQQCPPSIKLHLRNISIAKPDLQRLLKIQLIARSFKSYKIITNYLVLLKDCVKNQLHRDVFTMKTYETIITQAWKNYKTLHTQENHHNSISNPNTAGGDGFINKYPSAVSSVTTFSQSHGGVRGGGGSQTPITTPAVQNAVSAEITKFELNTICKSVLTIVNASLSDSDSMLFKEIVRGVFGDHADSALFPSYVLSEEMSLLEIVKKTIGENGLSHHKLFEDKIMQLYQVSQINQGIVICGQSKTGKSTLVQILIQSLGILAEETDKENHITYHQEHINVLAVSSLEQIFGCINEAGDWVNGVFTVALKKANQSLLQHKQSTWITLDGPLHDGWCSALNGLFEQRKVYMQPDMKQHHLNKNVTFVYETHTLDHISPTVFANMSIVYMDNSALGWRPLANAWLAKQDQTYFHVLQRSFHKSVDRCLQFVQDEARCCVTLSEGSLFSSCLSMLSSLLRDHQESLAGELHIERLYLFSLIWTFGSLLIHDQERHQFNALLLSLSNALPDDDREISVFDYFVDESGEWDSWATRLSEASLDESIDSFGQIFVETVSSHRTKFLISQYMEMGNNILLAGPTGCGKTKIIQDLLKNTESKNRVTLNIAFSNSTDASFLQNFIAGNLYHRQGFVYGAKKKKTLRIFIDDIHLPKHDICDVQSSNQLLRQLVDQQMIYTLQSKHFKPKYIEGMNLLTSLNPTTLDSKSGLQRLLGRFGVFYLPQPNEKEIFSMASVILEANMSYEQGMSLPQHLHSLIVELSTKIVSAVTMNLQHHALSKFNHYKFNIGDLKHIFQMLRRCPEEERVDEQGAYLLNFWYYETQRTFLDRILNPNDIALFERTFDSQLHQLMRENKVEFEKQIFTTFLSDSHLRMHRPANSKSNKKKHVHQLLTSIDDLDKCIEAYENAFSNETGETMDIVWHSFHKEQFIKCHRILSQENRGNLITVTSAPNQMLCIVKLSTFMLSHQFFDVDCTNKASFIKCLRVAVRIAGCDNRNVSLCIQTSNLKDLDCLGALHSIMLLGEYVPLFSETEIHGLLVALRPKIKRAFSEYVTAPMKFFTKCVMKNLHVIFLTMPNENFISYLQEKYPVIVAKSHVSCIPNNYAPYLKEEIKNTLPTSSFWSHFDDTMR